MFEDQISQAKLTAAVLVSIVAGIFFGFAFRDCSPPSARAYRVCADTCAPHSVVSVSKCECGQ